MNRLVAALMTIALAGPSDGPPVKKLDDEPAYVAVRKDVFETLNLSDINLPKCEVKLADAQRDLRLGQINIDELHAAAKQLEAQKADLNAHIERLEAVIQRYADYTATLQSVTEATAPNPLLAGWESVDGTVGLVTGWAVGTGQCVALAWVFNQPAFGGGP